MFQSLVMGFLQGITEFLPISSSGHLLIVEKFFAWPDLGLLFDAFLHLGTLGAVILYFRKDIIRLTRGLFRLDRESLHTVVLIVIGIIPAALVGYFGKDMFAHGLRLVNLVIFNLIFWGVILYVVDRYTDTVKNKIRNVSELHYGQALIIGLAQVLALLPGTSRSGITIIAGLIQKTDRTTAARYSFLMSMPLIAAAGMSSLYDLTTQPETIKYSILVAGLLSSFISGWLAITFLMKLLGTSNLRWLAVYRVVLGLILALIIWLK